LICCVCVSINLNRNKMTTIRQTIKEFNMLFYLLKNYSKAR
jgi:hypothetical protein